MKKAFNSKGLRLVTLAVMVCVFTFMNSVGSDRHQRKF